jgi:hypothetical protein
MGWTRKENPSCGAAASCPAPLPSAPGSLPVLQCADYKVRLPALLPELRAGPWSLAGPYSQKEMAPGKLPLRPSGMRIDMELPLASSHACSQPVPQPGGETPPYNHRENELGFSKCPRASKGTCAGRRPRASKSWTQGWEEARPIHSRAGGRANGTWKEIWQLEPLFLVLFF